LKNHGSETKGSLDLGKLEVCGNHVPRQAGAPRSAEGNGTWHE
jgi:hypothetical protein